MTFHCFRAISIVGTFWKFVEKSAVFLCKLLLNITDFDTLLQQLVDEVYSFPVSNFFRISYTKNY